MNHLNQKCSESPVLKVEGRLECVRIEALSASLLQWFDQFGRHDLPWQQDKTPYRVWVSEIMLQQTQVATVVDYYLRFMERFPTLEHLAEAEQDEVLALWAGLGYYARGRNLHRAAQEIMQRHHGLFPTTFEEVLALPGIGRSTAGAIMSIALGQRYAILDGNVKRVLSRLLAVETWPGERQTENRLWQVAERLTPEARFEDYTQAIMDLGATVCTRSRPKCEQCPWQVDCQAHQLQRVSDFPVSKPKAKQAKPTRHALFLWLENERGEIWLQQRPQKGIWGGLWSLPEVALSANQPKNLTKQRVDSEVAKIWAESAGERSEGLKVMPAFKHTFTHYHLWLYPLKIVSVSENLAEWQTFIEPDKGAWYAYAQLANLGLPAPIKFLTKEQNNE